MQRINRHEMYLTDRTKQNHWCEPCFNLLKADEAIMLDDGSVVEKKDLQSFKNDALPEEGWVNCDSCNSWVHQVCSLFNGRTNKSNARYTCPNCYLLKEEEGEKNKLVKGAEDLARCTMSDAIERGLNEALEAAYKQRGDELGIPLKDVERANRITVRVLSNTEKKHIVGEEVRRMCSAPNGYI
jgi:E1A/CREB-binding protein